MKKKKSISKKDNIKLRKLLAAVHRKIASAVADVALEHFRKAIEIESGDIQYTHMAANGEIVVDLVKLNKKETNAKRKKKYERKSK